MIDRKAIWLKTYQRNYIGTDECRIEVFSAIHHNETYNQLTLCNELSIRINRGKANLSGEIELAPDELEQLAGYLIEHAAHVRQLQTMLDEEESEIKAAVLNDMRTAMEAA